MKICLNRICIFFVLFFITSCGVKKNVVKELESININDIVSQINFNKINSNWLYVKGKIKMISNNDKVSLGVSMKIRQDSLIWLSISAPIIGEINRVMLTPDSLYVINRPNSTWLIKPIKQLKNQFGVSLSYSDIQAFLSNNIRIPVEQIKNENRVLPPYPITNNNDQKANQILRFPRRSEIDPNTGLKIAIAIPEIVCVIVNFCAPSSPTIKTSAK